MTTPAFAIPNARQRCVCIPVYSRCSDKEAIHRVSDLLILDPDSAVGFRDGIVRLDIDVPPHAGDSHDPDVFRRSAIGIVRQFSASFPPPRRRCLPQNRARSLSRRANYLFLHDIASSTPRNVFSHCAYSDTEVMNCVSHYSLERDVIEERNGVAMGERQPDRGDRGSRHATDLRSEVRGRTGRTL